MPHQELVIDGRPVPSVTEIISVLDKPFLRGWYAKEELQRCIDELAMPRPDKQAQSFEKELLVAWRRRVRQKDYAAIAKAERAKEWGISFHTAVYNILRHEPYSVVIDIIPSIHSFLKLKEKWAFRPTKLEFSVRSEIYDFHGTGDYIGEDNVMPGLGIGDWKTSNSIGAENGLQIALYAYAFGEQEGWSVKETWEKITHGFIARFDKKTGLPETKLITDLPHLFRVAIALRELYDFWRKVGIWEEKNGR